jgi:hypothetical protein
MQRYKGEGGKTSNNDAARIKVSVCSKGNEPITVQTRGRQRFLTPNVPYLPDAEFPPEDSRPRIIDPESPTPRASIQVLDISTGEIVLEAAKPGPCGLHQEEDPRPTLEFLTTLEPDEPLVRYVDVSSLISKLPDGKYGLRMEPRGMWWCTGGYRDFGIEPEDRVPHHVFSTLIPPVILRCEDVVELKIKNGTVLP